MKEKILLIDVCVRKENSRTLELAEYFLKDREYTKLSLAEETIKPLDNAGLDERNRLLQNGDFENDRFRYARQFAQAEEIVIAAPYWDLSFPALLKTYIENICVLGVTFEYTSDGMPKGLCHARKLTYITTAGGCIPERNFGYDYVKELAETFFGIKDIHCIKAEMLDVDGQNPQKILSDAKNKFF